MGVQISIGVSSQKMERLAELNTLLDMDHHDNEIVDGEPDAADAPERKERCCKIKSSITQDVLFLTDVVSTLFICGE